MKIQEPFKITRLLTALFFGIIFYIDADAVTNQDLLDKLDDIEFEQQIRELNRERDKLLLLQLKNQQLSAVKRTGCDNSYFQIVYKNSSEGIRACVFKDGITKTAENTISIMYLVESEKPSYHDNLTYFNTKLYSEIDCSKRKIKIFSVELQDAQFKKLTSFPIIRSKFESYGDIGPYLHKYVCN